MRLIDAEELKDDMAVLLERNEKLIDLWLAYAIDDTIDEQTVIEAEPVRRGRWLAIKEKAPWLVCSECGTYLYNEQQRVAKYCYNCGAKMEEQEGD